MSLGARAKGFLDLCRPMNSVVAGVLTFIGAYVAGRPFATEALIAAVVTVLATAAGNAINDYFDRDIDAINAPERPIPRGAVSARSALAFSLGLFAVAVALSALLPLFAIGIAAVNLVALLAYTTVFKGLPGAGNAVVAALGGSTFLFGAAAVSRPFAGVVLAALAALSTFAREVVKDVEDVEGDREEGLNTLPIAVGERPALLVAAAVLAVAVLASPLPYLTGLFGVPYLVVVVPADAVMAYAAYLSFSDPTRAQGLLKYGMFLAAAAFVAGRAFA
ncbi:geranylgeranylglycerol-phosphate geranylgeranyltransferase [Halarchaeum sp. P4]|uniref:geranylgeranylglycerol-phosphate geranylgeranyltransferase n=1 Tax=Halarchaeum sp. P4 TaxID=3421639 RepID=UPI003EBC057D